MIICPQRMGGRKKGVSVLKFYVFYLVIFVTLMTIGYAFLAIQGVDPNFYQRLILTLTAIGIGIALSLKMVKRANG